MILVEVRGEGGSTWHRRVIHSPVGLEWISLLSYPGVTLRAVQKVADPAGGLLVLCESLEGEHFVYRLRECLFERCPSPEDVAIP